MASPNDPPAELSAPEILQLIQHACTEVLGVDPEEVNPRSHFELDLVAGPEERAHIFSRVQEQSGVTFDPEELQSVITVSQLIELIEESY